MLLKEFEDLFLNKIIDLLWMYWIEFGIPGYSRTFPEKMVAMDPEALFLLSTVFCRYDPRLFDEALNWLGTNGEFINILRLKNLLKNTKYSSQIISAIADHIVKNNSMYKWKGLIEKKRYEKKEMLFYKKIGEPLGNYGKNDENFLKHGLIRGKIVSTKAKKQFPIYNSANLFLRVRTLFGVNSRSDIIAYLMLNEGGHPAKIARELSYSQKGVYDVLSEIERSGFVSIIRVGKEKQYILNKKRFFDLFDLRAKKTVYINWNVFFRSILEIWILIQNEGFRNSSDLNRSSYLRQLLKKIIPEINSSGVSKTLFDTNKFFGESLLDVAFKEIIELFEY